MQRNSFTTVERSIGKACPKFPKLHILQLMHEMREKVSHVIPFEDFEFISHHQFFLSETLLMQLLHIHRSDIFSFKLILWKSNLKLLKMVLVISKIIFKLKIGTSKYQLGRQNFWSRLCRRFFKVIYPPFFYLVHLCK